MTATSYCCTFDFRTGTIPMLSGTVEWSIQLIASVSFLSSNMNLDFQHDESILFILSMHESMVESTDLEALDKSTLILYIPSSDFEFNDGISLISTRDLEIRLSMLKLKMEYTDLEPKDMELTKVVNV